MDYRVELGKAIREARVQRKMSIQDLHYEARISLPALTNIEHGRIYTRLDTLLKICQVLQVKPSTLFGVVDRKL
jgi:transcriptional regulator with XRE-family HTH domain